MPMLVESWGLSLRCNIWTTFHFTVSVIFFLQDCDVITMRTALSLLPAHYLHVSFFFTLLHCTKCRLQGTQAQSLIWDCSSGLIKCQPS